MAKHAALFLLASGCGAAIYYPKPVSPLPGWESGCAQAIVGTVVFQNDRERAVSVLELLPADGCPAEFRGAVQPGETVDLGQATGSVWRAVDSQSRQIVASFELVDGENALVLP